MSRQRNVEKTQIYDHQQSSDIRYDEDYSPTSKPKEASLDYDIFGDFDNLDILGNIWKFFKFSLQLTYSITPFIIIYYFFQLYYTPLEQVFYYPDFPNSFKEASVDVLNSINVEFYDLSDFKSTANGWQNEERILFLVPLRDASSHLPLFFSHMANLTYPHHLIDMSFLISDTSDSTLEDLQKILKEFQTNPDQSQRFGRIEIFEKDFGQIVGQSFSDRHGFAAQGPRRKKMAIARNWLLTTALRPDHAWVYWRDIDVETCPSTVLEDLMHHDKDVIVPNIWRPLPDWLGYEQAYDLNSWQESEGGIELADRLEEDAVIVEGYPEYATWRPHLAYLRDPYGDPEVEIELDGIGGVSILSKAHVFRRGAIFPAFSFKKHAETEAFGKLCKTMGFEVIGLPHYVIWHIYEPSTDDLKHMEWLANEEIRHQDYLKNKVVFDRAWKMAFEDVSSGWEQEKFNIFKNNDLSSLKLGKVHWDEVDEYLVEVDDDLTTEKDNSQVNDDGFLMNFNHEKSKLFEQSVLAKLTEKANKFGSSKHEVRFDNFEDLEGLHSQKTKKFAKFENVYKEEAKDLNGDNELGNGEVGVEEFEDEAGDALKGKYDLKSDKVIDDKDPSIKEELISDKTINDDKKLFNNLESNKIEIDGEEEGGVEFEEQTPVEEAILKAKLKKKLQRQTTKKRISTRTLYEIDDDGATVATILQTVTQKPIQTKEVEIEYVYEDEVEVDGEVEEIQAAAVPVKKVKKVIKKAQPVRNED